MSLPGSGIRRAWRRGGDSAWPWGVVSLPMEVSDRLLQSWVQLPPPHARWPGPQSCYQHGTPGRLGFFHVGPQSPVVLVPPVLFSLTLCFICLRFFFCLCVLLSFYPFLLSTSLFASLCFPLSVLVCLCLTFPPSLSLSSLVCVGLSGLRLCPLPLLHPDLFLCLCLTLCLPFLLSPVPRTFTSLDSDNCCSLPLSWRNHKSFHLFIVQDFCVLRSL